MFVEHIIEREKPDAILLTFGGQTALNCGIELHKAGIFQKHNVTVLGTPMDAIMTTEDRKAFAESLRQIGVSIAPTIASYTVEEALAAAEKIGYPIIIRSGFSLGGLGSGFAANAHELSAIASLALAHSPQLLVEKSLRGWKEIEYEMVRDADDNCVAVCNMENLDPMGIHTGDSIVVAPSQTLTNDEYHQLRQVAIKVVRHLGIIGECNIQFALNPQSEQYYVIEVNARLSRSSALASKATGYPLASIAAKLALNKSLVSLRNPVTKVTTACFEPALDYIVVKVPRWDLQKFSHVSTALGSSMKSVGEVMAIGRSFEEALQKALRMTDTGLYGIYGSVVTSLEPSDKRILAIGNAIASGMSLDEINTVTGIDRWFLTKIQHIVAYGQQLQQTPYAELTREMLLGAKKMGFSDSHIALLTNAPGTKQEQENALRAKRLAWGIVPVVKQIDTVGAEWPAKTNYLYMTYHGTTHDVPFGVENTMIVLGSGPYRIGSSVEFDWCCVTCVQMLRLRNYHTLVINCNPETVSTDYDICDRLYFEELSMERVLDIIQLEQPQGIIVSMGGQTPNNLVMGLYDHGAPILGTHPTMIDAAEDRKKFSALLDKLGIDQPEWTQALSLPEANEFAARVGYPVIIRPSYVLSGAAMRIVAKEDELERCLNDAACVSADHPVVISKFIERAKEIEMDAVAEDGALLAYAISEHVEEAGVHSGDATLVLPAQKLYLETVRQIKQATRHIARELKISGPFNIQYLAKGNKIKVIECNLRCSRTFPFVSKVLNVNFVELATRVLLNEHPPVVDKSAFSLDYVGVKAPQFSFTRLAGADPVSGVEMASTGEVACLGYDIEEAFMTALLATGFSIPKKNIFLSTGPVEDKAEFLDSARTLQSLGYTLFASEGTARFLNDYEIPCVHLFWPLDDQKPNITEYLRKRKIDLVINIPKSFERAEITNDSIIRRLAVDYGIPLITNMKCAVLFVEALRKLLQTPVSIRSWQDYLKQD